MIRRGRSAVRLVIGLLGVGLLVGCGATLTGGVVADSKAPHPGVRYRVAAPFEVSVYYLAEEEIEKTEEEKTEEEKGKRVVKKVERVRLALVRVLQLPDPMVLRELNYRGALLRSYDLGIDLNVNGTLGGVDLLATGTPQGGVVGEALTDTIEAIRKAQDPRLKEKEALDRENELLEAKKKNRELKQELGLPK